ncbi:MAG: B12-binding domain-containing radical SAM protein [Acidimicrobiales bacterium]|nr:B12-binding domain-containing radical SAM protein [Acidimicrobiales bacterium]
MARRRPVIHLILPRADVNGLHHVLAHRFVPLQLMTVGALCRREGWDARIIDENYDPLPDERPDLVGITVWTMFAPRAFRIADRYRAAGVPVVLGGVHASLVPGEALRHADAVVVGEAETVMGRVLADTEAGCLRGIYRGEWDDISRAPTIDEMGEFYDRFPTWRYWPQYSIQSTRGCRFNCDYCSVIRINGRGQRHRDPNQVVAEVARRMERTKLTAGLFFTDDDFGSDLEYTYELLGALADARLKVKWTAQLSIGIARHEELLALARRAGCAVLFLGLESMTRDSLVEANKKNRPNEYAELVGRIHEAGIATEGAFIFGFDHDDRSVFERTVEFADELGIDLALFNVLTPAPGTATFARYWDEGRIVDFDWSHYTGYQAVFEPANMSRAELEGGLRRAYRDFYSRGRRLRRFRRHLRQLAPDMAVVLAGINWSFAREFKSIRRQPEPPYSPPLIELERLAAASRVEANRAIWFAADQADGLFETAPSRATPVVIDQSRRTGVKGFREKA